MERNVIRWLEEIGLMYLLNREMIVHGNETLDLIGLAMIVSDILIFEVVFLSKYKLRLLFAIWRTE